MGISRIASLEMSRLMKRISLLVLGLCTVAWTTGCCHSYYSRYHDRDDSCSCDHEHGRGRHKHRRGDKADKASRQDGYGEFDDATGGGDCCDSCCDCGAGHSQQSATPAAPYMGSGEMMGGGCASGNCGQGATMGGGCASGNCGSSTQNYGGLPFNPADGWTIQSTTTRPVGNEPVMAPGSTVTPIAPSERAAQGWVPSAGSSSAPVPAPVPPPVSYNR